MAIQQDILPPVGNYSHGIVTTPPHRFDDASDAAMVAFDAKRRALYQGSSWDMDDRLSRVSNSAHRCGLLSVCIARPFTFAIAAKA